MGVRRFGRGWIAFSGVELYSNARDPDSVDYVDDTGESVIFIYAGTGDVVNGILFEAVKTRFFTNGIVLSSAAAVTSGVYLYKCLVLDSFNSAGHSQGLSTAVIDDLIVEECILDHNGWYSQAGTGDGRV